ncbi:MAG: hypothetical protein M3O82_00260 [Verrucomicrobiota bacterium]|nr:hypothetical protein [Verrucomicrobiota bacterium]
MDRTVQLLVEDVAFGGAGVGHASGKAVFVPFTIDGETVSAEIVREKKKHAEARLGSIEIPSPHRAKPACPYFGRCGGCSYQHIAYDHQLALKSRQVEQTLRRLGRLKDVPMSPIVPSPKQYAYRNRIRVHAEDGVVGFFRHDRHELLDIEFCPIASAEPNEDLRLLRKRGATDGDYVLAEREERYFEQTNREVAAAMLQVVFDAVGRGQRRLVDAFCGAGFFAKGLAPLFEEIVGIESNGDAVNEARRTATAKETYIAADVSINLAEALAAGPREKTTLILDPPAAGLSPRAIDAICGAGPSEVFYVSCNPATLARDLQLICRAYELIAVTPLDMFPQTAQIEVVVHLRSASQADV